MNQKNGMGQIVYGKYTIPFWVIFEVSDKFYEWIRNRYGKQEYGR
jgi:hypothetical protein